MTFAVCVGIVLDGLDLYSGTKIFVRAADEIDVTSSDKSSSDSQDGVDQFMAKRNMNQGESAKCTTERASSDAWWQRLDY